MNIKRLSSFSIPFACAAVSLTVYLRTMLPGVGGYGDTSKFQFIGAVMGLPHPSGFPLYLFLNALFARLPWGSLAWRINFMSALFGALTVGLFSHLILRLTKRPGVALFTPFILAFSFNFWSTCLVAEVYTLTFFLIALTILLLHTWRETGLRKWFYPACAVYALSFGNHLMVISLLPAFLFFVIATDRRIFREPKAVITVCATVFLAASLYLFLLLRSGFHPVYCEGEVHSLKELARFATGGTFSRRYFPLTARQVVTIYLPLYGRILVHQLTWPGIILAVCGFLSCWYRKRVWAIFLLLVSFTTIALYLNGPHIEQPLYFIPATMALTLFIPFAGMPLPGEKRLTAALRRFTVPALTAFLAAFLLIRNFPLEDLSGKTEYERAANRILERVRNDSIILSPNYHWTEVLLYKLLGEGSRAGDGVFVLHHWDAGRFSDYTRGTIPTWDPYRPAEPPGEQMNLYLFTLEEAPAALNRVAREGWKARRVFELVHPVVRELRALKDDTIVCAAVKDEGITIMSDEGYDAVRALGLRTRASFGDTFGWAAAGAVIRSEGGWGGWQYFRYAPVEITVTAGSPAPKTPFSYPVDLSLRCAGYGRGNSNRITIDGSEIALPSHGFNFVLLDRVTGNIQKTITIPPDKLGELRSLYLYELIPPEEGARGT